MRSPHLRKKLTPFGTTIFAEMTELALLHDAINLSQGFPDEDGPDFLREAAAHALLEGPNQYARSRGVPALCSAIAADLGARYGLEVDPLREVGVFSGATEAIFAAMQGILNPGDEVVILEPFYDCYPAAVVMAGGIPRYHTLKWPDFRLSADALEASFSDKTRMLIVNTPHNPSGRVFTREELAGIAELCTKYDVLVLGDEVYEHLVYDGPHTPIATLPGMWERTITVSSIGKTLSVTGWKIGWAYGHSALMDALQAAHQFITFSTTTPLQHALARVLPLAASWIDGLRERYRRKRDTLVQALRDIGFSLTPPEGTYFILADISGFGFDDDVAFARYLTREIGVACIPPSAFYAEGREEGRRLARFAFCKRDATLEAAVARLRTLDDGAARIR